MRGQRMLNYYLLLMDLFQSNILGCLKVFHTALVKYLVHVTNSIKCANYMDQEKISMTTMMMMMKIAKQR